MSLLLNLLKLSVGLFVMSMAYVPKPSKLHAWGFGLLSLLLVIAVFASRLPDWIFIPLVGYFIYVHYRDHFGIKKVETFSGDFKGNWMINGEWGYHLLPASSIRRYWAILYFKKDKTRRVLAVFPDSLDQDAFRKLRVQARDRY